MFTSRLKPLTATILVALLLLGMAPGPARSATADEIKKQQDQIRERSKDTEDKAQAEKQAREREDARKAQELRDKQWKDENPNSPFPRGGNPDPAHQALRPPVAPGGMVAPPSSGNPDTRFVQAALAQIDNELKLITQRLQRLEQMLNAQGHAGGHAGGPANGGSGSPTNNAPSRSGSQTDSIADQQAQIRERSRAIENRAQAEANEKEWADIRKAQEQRNRADNSDTFITPSVVADYYLGPKEPRLRR